MSKEVVISNSRLNSYGFRVLTEGIDTEQYKRNPILLWMHNRPMRGTIDEVLPIGVIENLRVEGDSLIGTPVFDQTDDFAKKIQSKWEKGILKMVSAGLDVVEYSEKEEDIVLGQTRATVKRSKLVEVSIVDIGANDDALVLYDEGKRVMLSKDGNCGVKKLEEKKNIDNNTKKEKEKEMKEIAMALGLEEQAQKEEILQKINELNENKQAYVELQKKYEQRENTLIVQEVERAVKLHKITENKKDYFVELGKKIGAEDLKETLECMSEIRKPSSVINSTQTQQVEKKFSDMTSEEKIALRQDNREEYCRLYKEEYGFEPKFE